MINDSRSFFEDLLGRSMEDPIFGPRTGAEYLKQVLEDANEKGCRRKEKEVKVPIFLLGGPKDRQREFVSPRETQQYITFDDALYERKGQNADGFSIYEYMEDADEQGG